MSEKSNVKILAFVGLAGSGKSSAVEHLTNCKIPKISSHDIHEILDEVNNLENAGQHALTIDGLDSLETLLSLRRAHPGGVSVLALFTPLHIRADRLNSDVEQLRRGDQEMAENGTASTVIALADYAIVNDGPIDDLNEKIDTFLATLKLKILE